MAAPNSTQIRLSPVAMAVAQVCRGRVILRPRFSLAAYLRAGGPFRSLPRRGARG